MAAVQKAGMKIYPTAGLIEAIISLIGRAPLPV